MFRLQFWRNVWIARGDNPILVILGHLFVYGVNEGEDNRGTVDFYVTEFV